MARAFAGGTGRGGIPVLDSKGQERTAFLIAIPVKDKNAAHS
jgi:hypothetical protein